MRTGILTALALTLTAAGTFCSRADDFRVRRLIENCGGPFGLCGYNDRVTNTELIARKFERVMPFSQNLAGVKLDGKFGFIDETGAMIIAPRFDLVGEFTIAGLAEVVIDNKAGVINRAGEIVVETNYARAIPFTSETVFLQEGDWKAGHYAGHERLPAIGYEGPHGKVKLWHIRKGPVSYAEYFIKEFDEPSRGLVWATKWSEHHARFGLLRADGSWQVWPQYNSVQRLSDGLATVRKPDSLLWSIGYGQELDGAVDADGKLVVPFGSNRINWWQNGWALTSKDGRSGFLDKAGNLIGGRYFDEAGWRIDFETARVNIDGVWKGFTKQGKIVADPVAEIPAAAAGPVPTQSADSPPTDDFNLSASTYRCEGGVKHIERDGVWGLATDDGREIIAPAYRAISCFHAGIAWVPVDNQRQWCPITASGIIRQGAECVATRMPLALLFPEPLLDPDPFENSVLWTRAVLEVNAGQRIELPQSRMARIGCW